MDAQTILLGILAAAGSIGTLVLGVLRILDDRAVRVAVAIEKQESSIVSMALADRDYWRAEHGKIVERAEAERARADKLQDQLWQLKLAGDHATDVAQAALSAYEVGIRKTGQRI